MAFQNSVFSESPTYAGTVEGKVDLIEVLFL
jgi:hypothetical protein